MIDVYNLNAEKTAQMELNENIFGVPVRKDILHQVVVGQLNRKRSGTATVKTRAEIKGSKGKLYRQKGTGRSRVGSGLTNIRRGGGVAFGPAPRSYAQSVPKKVKKAAMTMALSAKVNNKKLIIVEDFDLAAIKTKDFVQVMKNFEVKKALIVTEDKNENLEKSSKNVPWVKVMRHQGINVYDILNYDHLFLVKPAIEKIEEALIS